MNEGRLLTWKLKTRQLRAEGMGVERRWRQPEEIKGCGELWAQPCQLPPRLLPRAEDPPAPATVAGAGPGPCGQAQVLGRPPSKVARHSPALRVEGAEAPGEGAPRLAPCSPLLPSGRRRGGERRTARWTPSPGAAAASSCKLAVAGVSFPAEPRHPLPSPHLLGCLGARGWRGIRAREAEAGGGGVSWRDPSDTQSPSTNALGSSGGNGVTLHPGSGGRGGARTTHGHLSRPLLLPRKAINVAAICLPAAGRAGGPGSHVAGCPGP